MTPEEEKRELRARAVRRAAILGAALAILCHTLPPEHRSTCTAVTNLVSLTCGG